MKWAHVFHAKIRGCVVCDGQARSWFLHNPTNHHSQNSVSKLDIKSTGHVKTKFFILSFDPFVCQFDMPSENNLGIRVKKNFFLMPQWFYTKVRKLVLWVAVCCIHRGLDVCNGVECYSWHGACCSIFCAWHQACETRTTCRMAFSTQRGKLVF